MKEQVSVDLFPVRDAMLSLERGQGELHEFNQKMIHKILFSAFVLRTYTDAEGLEEWLRMKDYLQSSVTIDDPAMIKKYYLASTQTVYDSDLEIMNLYRLKDNGDRDYVFFSMPVPFDGQEKVVSLFSDRLNYLKIVQAYNDWLGTEEGSGTIN
jgi:hypothetical protein